MKVVGLCGGSGSGKGAVAGLLAKRGFLHIDADKVYHRITSSRTECVEELISAFGSSVISSDGALDRRALSKIVFAEDGGNERLESLNGITHKHVLREIKKELKSSEGTYYAAVVDAPLLFEAGLDKDCDLIVSVIAPREMRIDRIMKRDNITRELAERRISAQKTDEFLTENSDYVITNDKDESLLARKVEELIQFIEQENYYGRENNRPKDV